MVLLWIGPFKWYYVVLWLKEMEGHRSESNHVYKGGMNANLYLIKELKENYYFPTTKEAVLSQDK